MNYSVTDAQLTGIADAIRTKTGGTEPLVFPDDFTDKIGILTDTSDADATAEYIHINKTAYVNGEKITGTGRIIRTKQVTKTWPSSSATVPAGGCIKSALVFQGTDTTNVKGVDSITTTANISIGSSAEFSYNQSIVSGARRFNMFFNNLGNSSISVPANAFTSVATFIY